MNMKEIPIYLKLICAFVLFFIKIIYGVDVKAFDDTIPYRIDWPGDVDLKLNENKYESIIVTSQDQEKYECKIPRISSIEDDNQSLATYVSPLHFLNPLFSSSCSYRIEPYWHYEICHGRYVKQYHEDREGKNIKVQEFYLGKWNSQKMEKLKEKLKDDHDNGRGYKTTKIDNVKYPYIEMEMTDGTLCDLNEEPRVTRIRYVCHLNSKNEIYSFKETSTCNYEAIILTPRLCSHPEFLPKDSKENDIHCLPINNSPDKPVSLLLNDIENLRMRYNKVSEEKTKKPEKTLLIKFDPKDGLVRMELVQSDLFDKTSSIDSLNSLNIDEESLVTDMSDLSELENKAPKISTPPKDTTPVNEFLEGKNCLTGGTGWWKFEFCYGRYVRQFHIDKSGENSLMLGFFDENLHKEWIKNNPDKRPKPKEERSEISHYYQGGTVCDKTGKKRQTEVKLKCLTNVSSLTTVSMYLLEPKTCQYILIVESPLICDILKLANDDGLVLKEPPKESVKDSKPIQSVYIGNFPTEDYDLRFENN